MPGAFSIIKELRRRKVFRGAALYLVGAWLVLQVADVIAEPAGLPAWTMTALLYVAAIGFPVALFLGWRYELGEHGLVRTAPAKSADEADLSLKASDYALIVVFLAVAGLAAWQLVPRAIEQAEESVTIAGDFVVRRNSVAVLPFQDYSPNADHNYLSNGLADNVTHVLGQVEGLLVTARTSAQAFRETTLTAFDIARELRVAHFLPLRDPTDPPTHIILIRQDSPGRSFEGSSPGGASGGRPPALPGSTLSRLLAKRLVATDS